MKFVRRLHHKDELGEYWIDIIDGKFHAWVKEFNGCGIEPSTHGHKFTTLHEAKTWIKLETMEFEHFTRRTLQKGY